MIIALSFLNTSPVIVLTVYSENIQPQVPLGQRGNQENKRISMASSFFLIPHLGTSSWAQWPTEERPTEMQTGLGDCDQELPHL